MCKRDFDIKLCACTDDSTKRIQELYKQEINSLGKKEFLKVIKWKLSKYIGREWSGMDGMMIMPTDKITEELTEEFLIEKLNQTDCFDFDYYPNDGDHLILEVGWLFNHRGKRIKRQVEYEYSSFIFRDQKWISETYNVFYEKTEMFKQGMMQTITTNKS